MFIICKSVVWLLFSSSNETVRSHSSRILQLEFPSSNHWQFQDGELPNQMMMKFRTKEVLIRKRFVIFWWSSLRFKHLHFVTERLLFHSFLPERSTIGFYFKEECFVACNKSSVEVFDFKLSFKSNVTTDNKSLGICRSFQSVQSMVGCLECGWVIKDGKIVRQKDRETKKMNEK